jgi:hypothetical protein
MRDTEVERGCLVPLAQCGITGVLAGLLTLALGLLLGWVKPWAWALGVGALAAMWWWGGSIAAWRRAIWGEEDIGTRTSTEERGYLEEGKGVFRVEVVQNEGATVQFADLPGTREQMVELCKGLASGASFSEASWTGRGRPFTRSQFQELRDIFLARGWAVWKSGEASSQGVALTRVGRAVVRHLGGEMNKP